MKAVCVCVCVRALMCAFLPFFLTSVNSVSVNNPAVYKRKQQDFFFGKPVVYGSAVNHLAGLPLGKQSILSSGLRGYKECACGWAVRMLRGRRPVHADADTFSRRGISV